jgi:hypothetical protein
MQPATNDSCLRLMVVTVSYSRFNSLKSGSDQPSDLPGQRIPRRIITLMITLEAPFGMYDKGHMARKRPVSGGNRDVHSALSPPNNDGEIPPTPDLACPILDELELSSQSFFKTAHL